MIAGTGSRILALRRVKRVKLGSHVPGLLVAALMLVGALLRMLNLDARGLWADELVSANSAFRPSFQELITWTQADYDQMPMFNLIVWLLRGLPQSEVILRMPAAIAGVLCIGAVYWLGRVLYEPLVGVVAAALMTFLPFAVWYSQEARIYTIFMLLTTLQLLFAWRVATRGRPVDWVVFSVLTILNLYAHYLALAVAASVYAFLGLKLALDLATGWHSRPPPQEGTHSDGGNQGEPHGRRALVVRFAGLALSGTVVALSYVPWIPTLQAFLNQPDKGFGRFKNQPPVTLEKVQAMLAAFNFTGVTLVLLGAGGVAMAVYAFRGKRWEGLLLLLWFLVPIVGLWLKMQGGILDLVPRYFSFLFPASLIVAALGVKYIVDGAGHLLSLRIRSEQARRNFSRVGTPIVFAAGMLLLAAQVGPALAETYRQPKDDYRGAARLLAAGPPRSIVITLGCYSGLITTGLEYYVKAQGTDAQVTNVGLAMTDRVVQHVQNSTGTVWVAALTSCQNVYSGYSDDVEIIAHTGLVMVRLRNPSGTNVEQASALVKWASAFDPNLESASDLLDFYSGKLSLSDNLLPAMTSVATADQSNAEQSWLVPAGATPMADEASLHLNPNGAGVEVKTPVDRVPIKGGDRYVLTFEYRNIDLAGNLRILAAAYDAQGAEYRDLFGNLMSSFPSGSGYRCLQLPGSKDWAKGAFSFTLPRGAASLAVILRATGTGTAAFRSVELRKVR